MLSDKDLKTIDELQYRRSTIYDAILTGDLSKVPPELLTIAIRAMSDIEKSITTRIKLTQGERGLDEEAAHNKLLSDILKNHTPAMNPPEVRELAEPPNIQVDIIEGELD